MSIFANSGLSQEQFLADYWQQQPCLLRQAFAGFSPMLDADDIAGLACEDLAESRLISGRFSQQDWTVRHGPFDERELQRLPPRDWTLLVQDVEKHYPPLQQLFRAFDFIPGWRMDDLMVSVAAPGGSVGPHYDQYDVFLLQAAGRRSWQLASRYDAQLLPGCDLKVLQHFQPEQEWELHTGDMLYLPPGIAHHGVALEACMTWSVGLRAPSQADLLLALGEWLAERHDEGERFRDPRPLPAPRPGEISAAALAGLQRLLSQPLQPGTELNNFLGDFISRFRLAHRPAKPETPVTPLQLQQQLSAGEQLRHNPWTRMNWVADGNEARLFAAGEAYACSIASAIALCSQPPGLTLETEADIELVCALINGGHLYVHDPVEADRD